MKEVFSTDISLLDLFIRSLKKDLFKLGISIKIDRSTSALTVTFSDEKEGKSRSEQILIFDEAYNSVQKNALRRARSELKKLRSNFEQDDYTPSTRVDSAKIDIDLEFLPPEKAGVGDYYAYYPRALSTPKGRKLHVLVWDRGQSPDVLIGMLTLSSAQYFHGGRDKKLCWVEPDSYIPIQPRKNEGLKALYNVSNCFAFSCYQFMHASKMIALLPFTDLVADEIFSRYGAKPLAFTTSSAFRSYATPFRRTNVKSFKSLDDRRHKINRSFYEKLSSQRTSRVRLFGLLSDKTIAAACNISYRGKGGLSPNEARDLPASEQVRAVKTALAQSRLPQRLLEASETVVYLGYAREDCLDALRDYKKDCQFEPPTISVKEVQDYWITQWVNGRGRNGGYDYNVDF
ncbi:MAG: hypothetical protein AAFR75_01080 [Pseudomonadota bacterium]